MKPQIKFHLYCLVLTLLTPAFSKAQDKYLYKDPSQPIDTRVKDLVSRLTLEEKVSLLGYQSKAVPRLGIPAYNWWNEALHGVARAGEATIFPQALPSFLYWALFTRIRPSSKNRTGSNRNVSGPGWNIEAN